jgi:ferredoxin
MTISVDEVKCKMCKKCISECPTTSLALTEGKISQVAPTLCLACGHCSAVCMENALSWDTDMTNRSFELTDYPIDNSHVIIFLIKHVLYECSNLTK